VNLYRLLWPQRAQYVSEFISLAVATEGQYVSEFISLAVATEGAICE